MISYEDAKSKAALECSGYDLIGEREDENYFRFSFGIKGELTLPGMPEILIEKNTGEIVFYNIFTEIQKEHENDDLTSY